MGRFGWRKPDYKSGIFFLLLGLWVCFFSWKIGLGSPAKPGPGFMPFLAGLLLAFLSFLLVIQVLFSWTAATWATRIQWKNTLLVLAAMVAYGFLLDKIGFVFVTFLNRCAAENDSKNVHPGIIGYLHLFLQTIA